jgi:hypothetical protein
MDKRDKNEINSCLMLAMNLSTPVSLGCVFKEEDLKDTGVELDSHITLLYAQGKRIEYKGLLDSIRELIGEEDWNWLMGMIRGDEFYSVLDLFELGLFENDSDYVILKLRKGTPLFRVLSLINKGLSIKEGVKSEFSSYIPHLSLAELEPGKAREYVTNETLHEILEDSIVGVEDLFISYGTANEPVDREQRWLTSEKNISRFFRLINLKKELESLM